MRPLISLRKALQDAGFFRCADRKKKCVRRLNEEIVLGRSSVIKANELLPSLGDILGIAMMPGEGGACRVLFGETAVDFQVSGEQLFLIADLASAEGRESEFPALLKADWLGSETQGAVLGLDGQKRVFTLHMMLTGSLEVEEFKTLLANFVRAVRDWKERLERDCSRESYFLPGDQGNMIAI